MGSVSIGSGLAVCFRYVERLEALKISMVVDGGPHARGRGRVQCERTGMCS